MPSDLRIERYTIRLPVEDLTALFGQFYKTKPASQFISDLCRVSLHALVVQSRGRHDEADRFAQIFLKHPATIDQLAGKVAEGLAKRSSTNPSPP